MSGIVSKKIVAATLADTRNKPYGMSLIPYGLVGCLCCVWSTSHVPGRFPDLQIIACFTFSHIWVMQWFSKLAP